MNIRILPKPITNTENLINWAEWWEKESEKDVSEEKFNSICFEVEDSFEIITTDEPK